MFTGRWRGSSRDRTERHTLANVLRWGLRWLHPQYERCVSTLSPALEAEQSRFAAIARGQVPLLLIGETGTGKEVMARAYHELSRRDGRFIAVNCGALPSALVEAELFGHRQGSFSGSVETRVGLVRSAHKGTLFLDEIGDLPLVAQTALLRVLQENEVTPIGETSPVKIDVRVVAATHRDLHSLADSGGFRADLLARLEGYVERLPPLRERRCDLGILLASLLERIAGAHARKLTLQPAAGRAIIAHGWPKNIRELEQALRAAVALVSDGVITVEHLPPALRAERAEPVRAASSKSAAELSPADAELKAKLLASFEEHQGSINAVARAMGKDRTQIRRWLARLALDPDRWRG